MKSKELYREFEVRRVRRSRGKAVLGSIAISFGLFALLPFTQMIANLGKKKGDLLSIDITLPPPPPPPPEPPPPEDQKVDEPPPEMQQQIQQLSLAQLDIALNLGVGDAMGGAFAFEGFGDQPDALSELQIFDISDLDKAPGRVKTVPPIYPPDLRRARVQGSVTLLIIIDPTGRPKVERVIESTTRDFEAPAVLAAEQCLFEPPTKNGVAVRARYRMQVPFRL